jgi:hypothetical protein
MVPNPRANHGLCGVVHMNGERKGFYKQGLLNFGAGIIGI